MSKKRTEINPLHAERIKALLKREHITQADLARAVFQTQQNICRIANGKSALTEETARMIVKAFPEYRLPWLLGLDDYPTELDLRASYILKADTRTQAVKNLLESALQEVCAREGITPLPTITNPAEYVFLSAQLQDLAESLVWQYIKCRDYSHVWNLLDSNK